ncbi:hypothetical protein BC835DRAFT_1287441 [Cytidiella melzeri]|nr:hypothetical protein BC835DRAFT_1287441 [Cytidiella melzeri]
MAQQPTVMPQEMMPPQPHQQQISPLQNINTYYPETPGDLSGGLPINLDSLRDGPPGSKPFYPYSTLIRYAIKGAPNQKLLLEDIYYAIESRFPYFRTAPPGWKNSVRHNLSLNPCFEKVPRPLTDRGKGSYWTVNDNVDPRTGVHRVRKKKPKGKGRAGSNADQSDPQADGQMEDVDYPQGEGEQFQDQTFVPPPILAAEPGPSARPPVAPPGFPPPYGTFDPAFGYPAAMRYPPLYPNETLEFDEHGQVDWAVMWRKELQSLVAITEEQDKSGTGDQDWYRGMMTRLRTAMMAPEQPIPAPHMTGTSGNTGAVSEQ